MSRAGDVARTTVRAVGQLMITLGVLVIMLLAYELWFTNFYTDQQQHDLRQQLNHQWQAQPLPQPSPSASSKPPPKLVSYREGQGVGLLFMPRLGHDYAKVIVEGVGREDLKKGPGHYPGTALPGQIGNFVVSGHRTTYGAPFNRIDELHIGDPIVVETATAWYTYDVSSKVIVDPTDIAVIDPVPDHPGQKPTRAVLTFTTCNPKYSAAQRLIVHGHLADTHKKTASDPHYVPPALRG